MNFTPTEDQLAAQSTARDFATDEVLPKAAEIDRVYAAYPEMNDDRFVKENLSRWLS